jgi:hypothetical protein
MKPYVLGAPLASRITRFAVCCCLAEGFLPQLVALSSSPHAC